MKREQGGYVYKRHGWWILRYRQTVNQGGELITKQPAVRLVPVGPHYKTKASVEDLVNEKLREINRQNREPESVVSIADFVERFFLPYVAAQKRPSTAKGYRDVWEDHLRARMAGKLLRGVRTSTVQGWLDSIAAQDKTKTGKHGATRTGGPSYLCLFTRGNQPHAPCGSQPSSKHYPRCGSLHRTQARGNRGTALGRLARGSNLDHALKVERAPAGTKNSGQHGSGSGNSQFGGSASHVSRISGESSVRPDVPRRTQSQACLPQQCTQSGNQASAESLCGLRQGQGRTYQS